MIVLTILFFIFIFLLIYYLLSRRKLYFLAAKLPGPCGLPILGSALKFLCKQEDLFKVFLEMSESKSSPSKMWLGPKLMIVVKEPNQLQTVLQSSKITTKADFYRFLHLFLGDGLLTSTDPTHKNHKKLLQPFFSQRMVDGYSHLFQKHAKNFVKKIERHADGSNFDLMSLLFESIFESTMDVLVEDKNEHSIDYRDVPRHIKRFLEISFKRLRTFWLHIDFIFEKTSYYKELTEMKNIFDTMIEEILNTTFRKVLRRIESGQIENEETRAPSIVESLTEIGLENPKVISFQNGIDQITTLLGASLDTTSATISFVCLMLGAHPHYQDLIVKEIKEVLGDKKSFDSTDVSKLSYLEMCIKETLRLYTVVPFTFRESTEEFQLDNLIIPKGVTIALSAFHAHRDPNFWERPNEFYPEHFTPEAISKRHPFAFIPFSAGPRKCIAQLYSYTNLKIFISTILLNYEIVSDRKVEDIELSMDITLRPVNGFFIKIKKRTI